MSIKLLRVKKVIYGTIYIHNIVRISEKGDFMITVVNNMEMRRLKNVLGSMAIENMYLDESFINEMIKVANGEKSSEELRQEVIAEYAR